MTFTKNNPATGQSRFHVRNPHVVGAVLLHLEELVDIAKKGDSVAGMPRFLIGHFLSVCSKVAPEGLSSQEMQNLLVEDPHYFNDLSYDEVVTAATNVLLLADSVFPYHRRRDDEVVDLLPAGSRRSVASTLWSLPPCVVSSFQKDFNDMVDDYRKAKKASDGKASLLSKDKTRPLQFIPGIHVFEQGLLRLLSVAGVEANQRQSLSAEDLVRKVATINPDTFLTNFNPSSVPPEASQQSVDAAFSLSRWFQAVYQFSTNAPQKVADFRRERIFKMDIPQPSAKAFAEKLQKAACWAGGLGIYDGNELMVKWLFMIVCNKRLQENVVGQKVKGLHRSAGCSNADRPCKHAADHGQGSLQALRLRPHHRRCRAVRQTVRSPSVSSDWFRGCWPRELGQDQICRRWSEFHAGSKPAADVLAWFVVWAAAGCSSQGRRPHSGHWPGACRHCMWSLVEPIARPSCKHWHASGHSWLERARPDPSNPYTGRGWKWGTPPVAKPEARTRACADASGLGQPWR